MIKPKNKMNLHLFYTFLSQTGDGTIAECFNLIWLILTNHMEPFLAEMLVNFEVIVSKGAHSELNWVTMSLPENTQGYIRSL